MTIKSVYLAYPIDQVMPPSHMVEFYDQIDNFKRMLTPHVSWIFDPGDAFTANPATDIDPGLAQINRNALIQADAVVAFLPAGTPSVGVPMEIDRSRSYGKPTLVFSDAKSYMLNMTGVARLDGWSDEHLAEGLYWLSSQEPYDGRSWFGEIRWQGDQQYMPTRTYDGDAGFDLIVSDNYGVAPRQFMDISCGISVELPEGVWAMITGRSSTFRKHGLLVHTGIIDTGYRGPLFAGVWNSTDRTVDVHRGSRLAQLIPFSNLADRYALVRAEQLSESPRGNAGFGSTGA